MVTVGDMRMDRLPVRRAVLYPLRNGTLVVGSMNLSAEVIRQIGGDRFGIPYEGTLADVSRRSPQIVINARPLPPGPPVSAVGDVLFQRHPLDTRVAPKGTVVYQAKYGAHVPAMTLPIVNSSW